MTRKSTVSFFFLFAVPLVLAACTQKELIDSAGASMKSMCDSARNCTVNDPSEEAR